MAQWRLNLASGRPLEAIAGALGLQNDLKTTPGRGHFWCLEPKSWKVISDRYLLYLRHVSHPPNAQELMKKMCRKEGQTKERNKNVHSSTSEGPNWEKGAQRGGPGLQNGAQNDTKIVKKLTFGHPGAKDLHSTSHRGSRRWVPAAKTQKNDKYDDRK